MTRDFSTPIIIPLSKTKIMLIFAGLIFFGFCGVYAAGKLADLKPGIVIDDEGIIDNSSAIAAGRIHWDNMMGFTVTTIQGTKILNILVRSPQSYLEGKGRLARLAGAANIKMVGTPVNITSHALKIKFDDLVRLINEACIAHSKRVPRSEDDQTDIDL
ncbi:MAG: STM3941 family protein [Verrucomicrobiaceae bacterium]